MQVLKLVHGREFGDVQTVWQDTIWLALEKMLRLVGSNVGNSCEDIAGVRGGTLDTVSVINTTLSSFGIDIKVLEVVVEIDRTSAQVSTKKCGVGGEDRGNVNATLLAERKSYTSKPLVEVGNNCGSLFACHEL